MMVERKQFFDDSSEAIGEAYRQRDLGFRVSVGRDIGSSKWHVRIIDHIKPKAQGTKA